MESIAVVGIANLFPGSNAPETFWQQLLEKKDCRGQAGIAQMGLDPQLYLGKKGDADKYYCLHGGYISDFSFDVSMFINDDIGLTASYLDQLDDLHQWALFVSYQALVDAGYWRHESLAQCGAILGNLSFPTKSSNQIFMPLYQQVVNNALEKLLDHKVGLGAYSKTSQADIAMDNGLVAGYPSTLLANAAGLGAGHFSLDAACASSCYSIKLACDYLLTGKADMMLAGAVSAADPFFVNMGFSIFQAYPENQVHAPFDQESQGLFAGEGAGMMVLKRHSDAVRDGDKIYALIKGGALSNDGKGEFVLSPNTKGQVLVYERAYQNADVDPSEVDYVECHATGTPKGDKVELASMSSFFSLYQHKPLLGSVKSNLGHLLTAAGMPGMTKAIWALNEGLIPATINLQQMLPTADNYFTTKNIPTESTPWPSSQSDKARIAGVSVFGFGGSNAHLVIQQANDLVPDAPALAKDVESLAIIGMDAHFGRADSLSAFQYLLQTQDHTFIELPEQRWRGMEADQQLMQRLALTKAPLGGYIDHFSVDFLRFKIPPNDDDCLIPQQLLMMKVADNAILDAGLQAGENVAVLVAMGMELELHQYRGRVNLTTQIISCLQAQGIELTSEQQQELITIAKAGMGNAAQLNQYTSFIGNIMASRISALWDFSGPAITVSAEENSVYRCLELAQTLFQSSDIDAVVIACVDLAGSVENIHLRQAYGNVALTPDAIANRVNLDGTAIWQTSQWCVGEGGAALVVKPTSEVEDGQSYATIDAISFNNGSNEQAICLAGQQALTDAAISHSDIIYVEAHASGFINENLIEQKALSKLYPEQKFETVKHSVGHTFNASGGASLVKAALTLNNHQHGKNHVAINGLGKDNTCCHLILSSNATAHQSALGSYPKVERQLLKKITLGGASIRKKIVSFKDSQLIKQVKQAFVLANNKSQGAVASTSVASVASVVEQTITDEVIVDEVNVDKANNPFNINPDDINTVGVSMPNKTQQMNSQVSATHQAFLAMRQTAQQQIAQLIALQLTSETSDEIHATEPVVLRDSEPLGFVIKGAKGYQYPPLQLVERFNQPENIIWNSEQLVEFAEGKIANVFGPQYQIIDSYRRRVRLPTTDYLLVSRVTELSAALHEYKKSYMCTEYDIPVDAPFLIDGQIPWSVAVESGQCDLLLISYIGIDFQAKGERVYRLLDCQLTFLEEMAYGGETLRYEIHIDSYAKNGEQLLFFFHYDCYVGDKKVLIMRNGCAGFFTDAELADGKGVILTEQDQQQLASAQLSKFTPLLKPKAMQFDYQDMMKLVNGDITGCFGADYDQQGRNPSLKFSSEKFLMIERITKLAANAGHWGLGLVEGQKDLAPEHWYFPCHFKDDQVMAGSLMSEGCGQMAMFFMLSLGMHTQVTNARFQPMPGEPQTVRCRGQVVPQHNTLTYRMEVTALGMLPQPFLKANIDIILDGKVVVDFKNLSMMICEQAPSSPYAVTLPSEVKRLVDGQGAKSSNSHVETLNEEQTVGFSCVERPLMSLIPDHQAEKIKGVMPIKHVPAPWLAGQNRTPDTLPFTPWHLFEFATGDISQCFGREFDIYQARIPPRTPCGGLQLVTQVVAIEGKRLDFKKPASCTAHYYVPEDAWYFNANSHDTWMPYAILMEIALQPNGFISAYMGTTLTYPEKSLFFRNLDGSGQLIKQLDLRGKTIVNQSVLLTTAMAGGAIIQKFSFELSVDEVCFYRGEAAFGYFNQASLTHQLGIDNGQPSQAWFLKPENQRHQVETFSLTDKRLAWLHAPNDKPYYKLSGGKLNFLDKVSVVESGGQAGLAYLYGERTIDASDWFFRYHFHQDPVMPGSLGVEAMIELLQCYALKNDLGASFVNPRFIAPLTQVDWKYRGQITPENKQMSVDVHITDIIQQDQEVRIIAQGNLSKDGLRIYQVKDLVLSIIEA